MRLAVRAAVANFHVSQLVSLEYWQTESARRASICERFGQSALGDLPHLPAPAVPGTLANLTEVMVALGMEEEVGTLAETLTTQCSLIPELELHNLYVPFLSILVPKLEILPGTSFLNPQYRNLFSSMIGQYWGRYAEAKPRMHWGLRSREINHSKCPTCIDLDGFLFDHHKQNHAMSNHAKAGKRVHLLQTLQRMNCLSYTEDKTAGKLQIVKRTSDFQMELKQWEVRGFNVRALLRGVNQQHLSGLLGDQYQGLTGMFPPANPPPVTVPPKQQRVGQSFCSSPLRFGHKLSPEKKNRYKSQPWQSAQENQENCPADHKGESSREGMSPTPCERIVLAPMTQNSEILCGTKRKFDGHPEPVRSCPAHPGADVLIVPEV